MEKLQEIHQKTNFPRYLHNENQSTTYLNKHQYSKEYYPNERKSNAWEYSKKIHDYPQKYEASKDKIPTKDQILRKIFNNPNFESKLLYPSTMKIAERLYLEGYFSLFEN
jgi:hypothetical protein